MDSAVDNMAAYPCATTTHGSIMLATNFKQLRFEKELFESSLFFTLNIAHTIVATSKARYFIFRFFIMYNFLFKHCSIKRI